MPRANPAKWLMLIHQIPAKPDYLRVKIRRRLGRLGAVALKNAVYVLPARAEDRASLGKLARDILREGGEAVVCETELVEGLTDGSVEDLMRAACDAEYMLAARDARGLASELRGSRGGDDARRRRVAQALERLRARFDHTVSRDRFGAQGRESVARLLSLVEDLVQGVEEGGKREQEAPARPNGATWVTRQGVMVDRIASAWLIRRFIDPAACFKFVSGRGYRPREGEIRFDMAGAEFTHHEALKPIAEIVHDLDLEDGRYNRPEAAGVDRMIAGLAIARHPDEARIAQGASVFDNLYESFRRRSR